MAPGTRYSVSPSDGAVGGGVCGGGSELSVFSKV